MSTIGFAISEFRDEWQVCWLPENKVWRPIDITQEQGDEIMDHLRRGFREPELQGFTLFYGNKGWQLSTRRRNEEGWSVSHISDHAAVALLSSLEPVEHPDGPWRVVPGADWKCLNEWLKARAQHSLTVFSEPVADLATGLKQARDAVARLTSAIERRL